MSEIKKINLRGWVKGYTRNCYTRNYGMKIFEEVEISFPPLKNPHPIKSNSPMERSMILRNFGIDMYGFKPNQFIDFDISIPIMTELEIKQKKLEEELMAVEKRLAMLAPLKEELTVLESKIKGIKNGN